MGGRTHACRLAGHADASVPPHVTIAAFEALTDAQKEEVWAYYDREIPPSETRPLTAAERRLWEGDRQTARRARGRGRPKVGGGAAVISVSVERSLLAAADAYAAGAGMTRAQLIAKGLRAIVPGTA